MILRALQTLIASAALLSATVAHAQSKPEIPSDEEVPIAILVDITSGQVLHARNPDRRFVPASITKVMTLYTAFQRIEEGALDPRQRFTVRRETGEEWGGRGSTMWLEAGDVVEVDNLLFGIANVSANDGSVVLAEGQAGSLDKWVQAMNGEARALGMANSHFGTPNGWPDEGATFTTARDLVTLAQALYRGHPDKAKRYIGLPGFTWKDITQPNRDPLIGQLRGADGIKTGYTNEAGFGYLGTAQRNGQRLVLVVAGIERGSIRARAARAYMEWGFSAFERETLFAQGEEIGRVRVQGGDARSVALVADRAVAVNIPEGRVGEMRAAIVYDGPVRAPFESGDEIATLVVDVPGMEPASIPLRAAHSVGTAGFFARIINGIAGWFA